MKAIFTILFLVLNGSLFAQTASVFGEYARVSGTNDNNLFEYQLTLHPDGTFFFHYHSNIKNGVTPEVNKYGKGTWALANNVVSFFLDKQKDFDDKHTLDLTNSKARFVTKSPRDKTDTIVETRLQFLESDISWMKSIAIPKIK